MHDVKLKYYDTDGEVALNIFQTHEASSNSFDIILVTCYSESLNVVFLKKKSFTNLSPLRRCLKMDFTMPNMDGPTAVREIRHIGYRGRVIGITGQTQPEETHYFLTSGADEVLSKPVNTNRLGEILEEVLFIKGHGD